MRNVGVCAKIGTIFGKNCIEKSNIYFLWSTRSQCGPV